MKKSKGKYIVIALISFALIIAAIIIAFIYGFIGSPKTYRAMNYEQSLKYAQYTDFVEEDFGEYENCTFKARLTKALVSRYGTFYTVSYTKDEYAKQMEELSKLEYLETPLYNKDGELILPIVVFERNDWVMRIVKDEESVYPKRFKLIIHNDTDNEIVYMTVICDLLETLNNKYEVGVSPSQYMILFIMDITGFRFPAE